MTEARGSAYRRLMEAIAPEYSTSVDPVMDRLADSFVRALPPDRRIAHCIDLGTGTGALADALLNNGAQSVTAVDRIPAILRRARRRPGIRYIVADLMRLPICDGAIDLAASQFGLNQTSPGPALRAVQRVLRPGGALMIQEWAGLDPLTDRVLDAAAAFLDQEGAPAGLTIPESAWEAHMQSADDYREALEHSGFVDCEAHEVTQPTPLPFSTFLRYRLAYLGAVVYAGPPEPWIMDRLYQWIVRDTGIAPDDSVNWEPRLFRAWAVRGG